MATKAKSKANQVEVWKDAHKGLHLSKYMCSTYGHIKNKETSELIPEILHESGYLRVELLSNKGKLGWYYVHKLIIITFKPLPVGHHIQHKGKWAQQLDII